MAARADTIPARPRVPMLTFLGAAGTVTGSRFLIDTPRARVLVDAGLYQGPKELRQRNWAPFPAEPASLDAVVLSHAHVDHCGYLPVLTRDGYGGPVWATPSTIDLAAVVLPDAGYLQEEEAHYANRTGYSKHQPALPLFTRDDAVAAVEQLAGVGFADEREVAPGVFVTFLPAGHILGSATVTVRLADHGDRRIVFSGDLGRPHHPLLVPPTPPGDADVIVCESTYGDRRHDDESSIERFAAAITATARRGGTVLIPAFAVDRTEVVLFHLRRLTEAGVIPRLPVYVDSPMALTALGIYRRAIAEGAGDVRPGLAAAGDVFGSSSVTEARSVEESKALAGLNGPMIIVSASGMATGGRVVHHLARLLPDPLNTVLLVGFQAPDTRGEQLANGARSVKMLGRYVPVRADVVQVDGFSVHADGAELAAWVDAATTVPEAVYLVHGEAGAAGALRDDLVARSGLNAIVARYRERVRLDPV